MSVMKQQMPQHEDCVRTQLASTDVLCIALNAYRQLSVLVSEYIGESPMLYLGPNPPSFRLQYLSLES